MADNANIPQETPAQKANKALVAALVLERKEAEGFRGSNSKSFWGGNWFLKRAFYNRAFIKGKFKFDSPGLENVESEGAFLESQLAHTASWFKNLGTNIGIGLYNFWHNEHEQNPGQIKVSIKSNTSWSKDNIALEILVSRGARKMSFYLKINKNSGEFSVSANGYGQDKEITKTCVMMALKNALEAQKSQKVKEAIGVDRKLVIDLSLPDKANTEGHNAAVSIMKKIVNEMTLEEKQDFTKVLSTKDKKALGLIKQDREIGADVIAGLNPPGTRSDAVASAGAPLNAAAVGPDGTGADAASVIESKSNTPTLEPEV